MAVTSLWRVRDNIGRVIKYAGNEKKTLVPEDSASDSIGTVLDYAARGEATEPRKLISGINCSPENAKTEMQAVKDFYKKTGGTLAYHGYQSFAEGEVTPEQAHEIGKELAERLWGDRYQVLVATHVDKVSHIHNHFVLNTVSFVDGIKYHRTKTDYRKMQQVSDMLCRERGLSVVRHPEDHTGKQYAEWKAEKEGRPTIRGKIREDIDRAVKASVTFRDYTDAMKAMGYELKLSSARGEQLMRPSLRPEGSQRFYRFDSLGKGYDFDSIIDRILDHIQRTDPFPEEELQKVRRYREEHLPFTKAKGIAALYYHYCYELHIIQKFPAAIRKVSQYMREDLAKLERLDEDTRLLGENRIETLDELNHFREDLTVQLNVQTEKRDRLRLELRKAVRRCGNVSDNAEAEKLRTEISMITKEIGKLRKNIKACDRIEDRSGQMQKEYDALHDEQYKTEILQKTGERRRHEQQGKSDWVR